jgi:ribosomal protein L39E
MVRVEFTSLGMDWEEVSSRLAREGVKANRPIQGWWRVVTHRDVDGNDAARLVDTLS